MKHFPISLAALALLALPGCQAAMYGTAAQLNQVSVGMPKDEVLRRLGPPNSTSAQDGKEYLTYRWMEAVVSDWPKDYFVLITDGKVAAYGRKGDFGSTRNPGVDINIKQDITTRDAVRVDR